MNQPSIRLPSFAKINWRLQVLGRRPDGYHQVRTTLQTISIEDELSFEPSVDGSISLSCDDPEIPTGSENLILRAAETLKTLYNLDFGVTVQLHKRIPTKAGLGGASSNAAVTLLALTKLWKIQANIEQLTGIASTLGADVPFFLVGGCAFAQGIGADVTMLPDVPMTHMIVVHPAVSISTSEAYRALNSPALTTNNSIPILARSPEGAELQSPGEWHSRELKNDFELVIFDIEPEIERAKLSLLKAGAIGALLAGSGSSVFGIFVDREAQQRAMSEIQVEAGWRVFDCVTVSRNEYVRAVGLRDLSS